MSTRLAKKGEIEQKWVIVDCANQPLGRVATRIANILRGKTKPIYTPHTDTGDFVVALNVGSVRLTGKKWAQKEYWRHSGFPGGISSRTAETVRATKPEELLFRAVKGMLPKNFLSRSIIKKLKMYAGAEHPHAAQQPQQL